MGDRIQAVMIFEILGKPASHIIESLKNIIDRLGEEKGIKVLGKKIREAKIVENSELFSSFAEVEAEVDDIPKLMALMFAYMPAHIEIIKPSELRMKNFDLNIICNDLMTKLHGYDGVAKTLMFEKENLISQIQQLKAVPAVTEMSREIKKERRKKKKV